ncbi:MAG: helix-turn-helix transcriptional regulator, partial [Clostridia bacterium]|nr:helix-turn-helix transcriptional regulator [Clostridia bacterium]
MNITIGENIKRLRRERNVTQEQLAEVLNISTAAVSKWERGETYPDI